MFYALQILTVQQTTQVGFVNDCPHLLSRLLLRSYFCFFITQELDCIGALSFLQDFFTHFSMTFSFQNGINL